MAFKVDPGCRYSKSHEWIRVEGDQALIGITDYAQQQLSDIVYVELPEVGDTFEQAQVFGVVESVKAATDCYLPVGGEIVDINHNLEDSPELVNKDPYGEGWFVKITIDDPLELQSLMDAGAYEQYAQHALEEAAHT
jgi:glycine cleavage system H protein